MKINYQYSGGISNMSSSLYSLELRRNFAQLKHLAPEQFQAFQKFNMDVFQDGALTEKEKEIIAVAITHVTQCPYCLVTHTKNAKKLGATLEELTEAVFVASALEAGGSVAHSSHVFHTQEEDASEILYSRSDVKRTVQLGKLDPDAFKSYRAFSDSTVKEGALSTKFKEIIAVAVATATQCAYCIDSHTKKAIKQGATNEELAEAILVTAALRAGGAYAHMANMIEAYKED